MTKEETVDYNQMMNYLMNIGDEVIAASDLKDSESQKVYDELKQELSTHKINLTEVERKELISKYGGSWNAVFGKLNAAGIKLNNAGRHMDGSTYSEIVDKFREIAGVQLDEEKTAVDQIATILDAMDVLKPSAYQWEGATDMDKALDVATTIIDRYYSMATAIKEANIVKGTEKGAAAVERAKKNEIKKLRAKQEEYKAKVNEEFQQLVEDRKKVIQEQQEFYKRQAEIEKNFRGEKREFNRRANMSAKELEKTARLQAQVQYQGLKDTEAKRKHKENIVRTSMRLINWMNKPEGIIEIRDGKLFMQSKGAPFTGIYMALPEPNSFYVTPGEKIRITVTAKGSGRIGYWAYSADRKYLGKQCTGSFVSCKELQKHSAEFTVGEKVAKITTYITAFKIGFTVESLQIEIVR